MDREVDTEERRWRIGELAKRTGLSVRALRHYDEIGLLVPSERSFSGYRLYSDGDLRRLYRIVALRQLGMRLEEISAVLEGEGEDPRVTVRRQLQALERQRELHERLRSRLLSILEVLDYTDEPSPVMFIEAIEVTIMIEKYYTPDQLAQLGQRERELGPEAIERSQRDWGELIAAVQSEREQGTNPTSPRMRQLARRWQELIAQFTGGDPGIHGSLSTMYENEPAESASHGGFDDELKAYIGKAIRALPPRRVRQRGAGHHSRRPDAPPCRAQRTTPSRRTGCGRGQPRVWSMKSRNARRWRPSHRIQRAPGR